MTDETHGSSSTRKTTNPWVVAGAIALVVIALGWKMCGALIDVVGAGFPSELSQQALGQLIEGVGPVVATEPHAELVGVSVSGRQEGRYGLVRWVLAEGADAAAVDAINARLCERVAMEKLPLMHSVVFAAVSEDRTEAGPASLLVQRTGAVCAAGESMTREQMMDLVAEAYRNE